MSDGTNDALTGGDDNELFNDIVSGTVSNDPAPETQPEPAPAPVTQAQPTTPQPQQPEPAIPPGVLREANERARAAERRYAELEARLAAFEKQQQPRQRSDVFENPSAFVKEEVEPLVNPLQQEVVKIRETFSRMFAEQVHGEEKVKAAYGWVAEGVNNGDPDAIIAYQRAMSSMNPYGELVKAHQKHQTVSEIGGDLNAYRQRILDEALKDQTFQAKVLEAARAQAQATGATIAKPVVASLPSITRVGATALSEGQEPELSDADLFNAATRRKRG